LFFAGVSAAQERQFKPGDRFKECRECPEMIVVPAGEFLMGSPEGESGREGPAEAPEHLVTIRNPIAIGRLPVTVAQWKACADESGCPPLSPHGAKLTDDKTAIAWSWTAPEDRYQMTVALADGCDKSASCQTLSAGHPVVGLSIGNVQAYLTWLSAKTGSQYRLPSEAEREYAARAGTTTPYYTGNHLTKDQANFCDEPEPTRSPFGFDLPDRCAGDIGKITVAGRFGPNAWGLFDVHGNIYEYTADCVHPNYIGAPSDGSAWTTACLAEDPVLRGGSFLARARHVRSAARHFAKQKYGPFSNVGFRVVRTLTVKPASAPR
jgi:formylglycine-generating enzyme required for sulfatase activity